MSRSLAVHSHKGKYHIFFNEKISIDAIDNEVLQTSHFIIDNKVATLHRQLDKLTELPSTLLIEATEKNKSLHQFPVYIEHMVKHKIRKNHRIIAIGGGVIQDISSFLAATILRGIDWWFYPTTLLAQADSCIGSKSSVNCGDVKNILGTFTPPKKIFNCAEFLMSLDLVDIKSGVGEMLKVHAIEGKDAFDQIAKDYENIFINKNIMAHYILRSLEIKRNIIEQDEFDLGIRKVMNYGHTFGHAIETATKYQIPHGIAVTIGMDMANYISFLFGYGRKENFERMHLILKKNYIDFLHIEIPLEPFLDAISKDKKNKEKNQLGLILPDTFSKVSIIYFDNDEQFKLHCHKYFKEVRVL